MKTVKINSMKCERCAGKGWNDNPRYNPLASATMYEKGIESRKKCKYCSGIGYIIGNVQEVVDFLKVLENTETCKFRLKEIKQCINVIENC